MGKQAIFAAEPVGIGEHTCGFDEVGLGANGICAEGRVFEELDLETTLGAENLVREVVVGLGGEGGGGGDRGEAVVAVLGAGVALGYDFVAGLVWFLQCRSSWSLESFIFDSGRCRLAVG